MKHTIAGKAKLHYWHGLRRIKPRMSGPCLERAQDFRLTPAKQELRGYGHQGKFRHGCCVTMARPPA